MPTVSSPAGLPSYIEDLLAQRAAHVDAIAVIDGKVSGVFHALGIGAVESPAVKAPPTPKAAPTKAAPVAKAAAPAAPRKRGAASKFGVSANEFVLAYVNSHKGATTQEINAAWKAAGRSGTADNPMSILTRAKKLKRSKVANGRGSKYTLA
jgi:hypothetical protein